MTRPTLSDLKSMEIDEKDEDLHISQYTLGQLKQGNTPSKQN